MNSQSRRIIDATSARPYAAWLSGMALAMLALGTYGALQPLLPAEPEVFVAASDNVEITDFQAPASAPAAQQEETPDQTPPEPEPDVEIPPVPDIVPPLTPPEVPELIAEDKPPPPPAKTETKPKPKSEDKPKPRRPTTESGAGVGSAGSGAPTLFTGGSGRFPEPAYPLAAKAAHMQGSVRLLVTVEASGIPSSVEVMSSSGSSVLDNAASDCIRRRWRWPSGTIRKYIVPVRFQLR